jgi:CheY-like chemotaxis protein
MNDSRRFSSASSFSPGPTGAGPSPAADVPELAGVRVLVVDDELDQLELAAATLRAFGAVVDTALSTREAQMYLVRKEFDVLVCDIAMPGESGLALIEQVRADSTAPHLRAVALTGFSGDTHAAEALAAGFDVHVPKPVDPAMFATVVAMLAGRT